MAPETRSALDRSARRLLAQLATEGATQTFPEAAAQVLTANDLAVRRSDGRLDITPAGSAHWARLQVARSQVARSQVARSGNDIDPFLGQHLGLAHAQAAATQAKVAIDSAESPLAWLARRKGRDGRPLIAPQQLQAGERLRADFTRAQMMPRTTANWAPSGVRNQHSGATNMAFTEVMVAARQRVRHAFDAVGPEFVGLLLDVCCFLKGLEDIERERGWPPRSAKVVLQLALDRLARHYGYAGEARGRARAKLQTWLAPDAAFVLGD